MFSKHLAPTCRCHFTPGALAWLRAKYIWNAFLVKVQACFHKNVESALSITVLESNKHAMVCHVHNSFRVSSAKKSCIQTLTIFLTTHKLLSLKVTECGCNAVSNIACLSCLAVASSTEIFVKCKPQDGTYSTIDEQNKRQRGVAVEGTKKNIKVLSNWKTSFISSTKRTHFTQNSPSKTESQTNFSHSLPWTGCGSSFSSHGQDSTKVWNSLDTAECLSRARKHSMQGIDCQWNRPPPRFPPPCSQSQQAVPFPPSPVRVRIQEKPEIL